MIKTFYKPSDRIIKVILYLIFASVSVYYGIHLSVPLVIDEVGTIANTAFLAGDDWSLCVQSMGGFYYKYGVSVLYLPFYLFFKNTPYFMYKAIMAFHMLIISFIPVIAYVICRKYLKINSWIKAVFLASASTGISSLWLYSLYSRSDAMLIFFPWIIVLILLELSVCDTSAHKIRWNILSFVLAFVTVYAFMSHSRGIILMIATLITLLFVTFAYKKNIVNYMIYLPSTVIMLVIDTVISFYFKNGVYGEYGTSHASIESFHFDAFMKLLTPKGITAYLQLCTGWLFNLSASSMGLVIIGGFASVIIIFTAIKKRSSSQQEMIISTFSLLCLIGTFMMGSLFFFPFIYDLMTGTELCRGDRMIYGRYTIGAVSPICFLALYSLTNKKNIIKWKTKVLALFTYITIFSIFITKISPVLNEVPQTNSRYFLSLTGFLNIEEGKTSTTFPDLTDALHKAGMAALIAFTIILIITCAKRAQILYISCILTFILSVKNFDHVFTNVRYARDMVVMENTDYVADYIRNMTDIEEIAKEYHTIFFCKNAYLLKAYQFELPEFDISSSQYIKNSNQDSFFIICRKERINTAIEECTAIYGDDNYYLIEDFDYNKANRDIIAVKGDGLAERLKAKGYRLKKYIIN